MVLVYCCLQQTKNYCRVAERKENPNGIDYRGIISCQSDCTITICLPRIKKRTSHLCPRIRWYRPPSRRDWNVARGTSELDWRPVPWPASSWREGAGPPERLLLPLVAESVWAQRGPDAPWIWRMCWRNKCRTMPEPRDIMCRALSSIFMSGC